MSIKKNIVTFWKRFLQLDKAVKSALVLEDKETLSSLLGELNEACLSCCGCYLKVEKADDEFFECTFLSGRDKTAQYICEAMKHFAPSKVKDSWIINEGLQPLSEDGFHYEFEVRDLRFGINDIEVMMEVATTQQMVSLKAYCPAYQWQEEAEKKTMFDLYLESMIGNVYYEAYIQEIEFKDEKTEGEWFPLADLYEHLSDVIERLNWNTYQRASDIYTAYKINEEGIKAEKGQDKVMITTSYPALFVEMCHQERFILNAANHLGSEYGELCYENQDARMNHELKQQINNLLKEYGLGKVIGGAMGLKYSYIELIVFDHHEFLYALSKMNEILPVKLSYQPL